MKKKLLSLVLAVSMVFTMTGYNTDKGVARAAGTEDEKGFSTMNNGDVLGNTETFMLSDGSSTAKIYVDSENEEISSGGGHDFCGLEIIGETFANDVQLVTGAAPELVTDTADLSGNVIIAGTIGRNRIIDSLVAAGKIDASGLYKDGNLKWDCYQMQFVSGQVLAECGYSGVGNALVIAGSNKRGAMYGLFNISEHMGVTPWVYMGDAVPAKYSAVYLDGLLLEFNQADKYLANEPSVKYRGFFINDEAPSFTGWAGTKFGGVNENCYANIFELIIRMKANYMWPAMWGNSFSDDGKEFKLANAVLADAYGVCMGTSHHEACHRAGVEWQRIYKKYGSSNAWDYAENGDAIYDFWKDGIERNGNFENTITVGMRGEGDSALKGNVQYNIDLLKQIISDQNEIVDNYLNENPDSKTKDALKIYIPYSENEEYYYGPDDGSIDGLNVWDGLDDVTIMLTDDNYGNVRSLPEEKIRNRKAGFGLYYHLDGHVGPNVYEWVSSTQLEHIWDQLTMTYDYNVRNIWVINVGDIKPLEMELNYAMDIAYDMEKWGREDTAEKYRREWLQKQLGGKRNCSDEVAAGVADCVADFLKISTYRKAEFVKSDLYSIANYNEAERVLDLCLETIDEADRYYDYFRGTDWDDAYYQLVYYQAVATANVTRMMIFKAFSDYYAKQKSSLANVYADMVDECIDYDKELTDYYNNTMSGGKWKKMMSSPHVGFIHWDSSGWSYPEGTRVDVPADAKMLVNIEGIENAIEEGSVEVPSFSNTKKQRIAVTMNNGGEEEYSFTVGTLADWINITNKDGSQIVNGGSVKDAAYFYISIDWTRVRSKKTGTVVIKGNGKTVKLTIKTSYTDYISKGIGTHIESDDVVTIDGDEFVNKVSSANGTSWEKINGYGRYKSAMKMFPVTNSFAVPTGNTYEVGSGKNVRTVTELETPEGAPYLEYRFYVDEDDDYTITAYTTTTNNIFKPSGWGYVPVELFYGIQVDDGDILNVNSLPEGKYISYAADGDNKWIDGIRNNIHISTSTESMSEGIHTVRIYGMHAGLGVERLVISNKDIKKSYLGPDKTFMLDYDIVPVQKNGIKFEVAAGEVSFGKPEKISEITDPSDTNDESDPVMDELPIKRPVPPADNNVTNDTSKIDNTVTQVTEAAGTDNNVSVKKPDNTKPVKGKTYIYKGLKYKITSLKSKTGKVKLTGTVKKNMKKVSIPLNIKIKGKTFKVTAIGEKAFKKCTALRSISIGAGVTTIGAKAFEGCKKLEQITVKTTKLKNVTKKAFAGLKQKIKIKGREKARLQLKKIQFV